MDSDSYQVIKGQINQPGEAENSRQNLRQHPRNVTPEFDMNNLNLNSSLDATIYAENLPNSVSSSSIALLNAKQKALKNMKRADAVNYENNDAFSNYNGTTDIEQASNENLLSEMNFFQQNHFQSEFDTRNSMPQISENNFHDELEQFISDKPSFSIDSESKFNNSKKDKVNKNKAFQVRSETVPTLDVSGQMDHEKTLRRTETDAIELMSNDDYTYRNANQIKKSKNNKAFALFGRYFTFFYFYSFHFFFLEY